MLKTASYYRDLLDRLYSAITGLDVSGYRWSDSDGWVRERRPLPTSRPTRHLEAWIDLGDVARDGSHMVHSSSLVYSVRYQPDDDGRSQGILHASISDVADLLTDFCTTDARTSFQTAKIEVSTSEYLYITVSFTTRYPWRA